MPFPVENYPHILDLILEQAPLATLYALRSTSKAIHTLVDTHLSTHLVLSLESPAPIRLPTPHCLAPVPTLKSFPVCMYARARDSRGYPGNPPLVDGTLDLAPYADTISKTRVIDYTSLRNTPGNAAFYANLYAHTPRLHTIRALAPGQPPSWRSAPLAPLDPSIGANRIVFAHLTHRSESTNARGPHFIPRLNAFPSLLPRADSVCVNIQLGSYAVGPAYAGGADVPAPRPLDVRRVVYILSGSGAVCARARDRNGIMFGAFLYDIAWHAARGVNVTLVDFGAYRFASSDYPSARMRVQAALGLSRGTQVVDTDGFLYDELGLAFKDVAAVLAQRGQQLDAKAGERVRFVSLDEYKETVSGETFALQTQRFVYDRGDKCACSSCA